MYIGFDWNDIANCEFLIGINASHGGQEDEYENEFEYASIDIGLLFFTISIGKHF
jgi:hypothetical protein